MNNIRINIPRQNFEIIHDRIGEILVGELDFQAANYNTDLENLVIYKERDIPFHPSEMPSVNVTLFRGEFEMQTLIQHNGRYQYAIEGYFQGKGSDDVAGDTVGMIKLQRLMGTIRAIIMNPKYRTLGFDNPLIINRHLESIEFGKPVRQDSSHTVMARMVLVVSVPETTEYVDAINAAGFNTDVKLNLTEKGYIWVRDI